MANKKVTLSVYTAAHFFVDLGCGWLVMAILADGGLMPVQQAAVVLLYNFLAFGIQLIIGLLTDIVRDRGRLLHSYVALLGCLMVVAALLTGVRTPRLSVVLVGLGNAAFHVGGGTDSLLFAQGKMGRGGIFVSSGAVGVALGMLLGGTLSHLLYIPGALTAVCALLILLFGRCREECVVLPADGAQEPPLSGGICGLLLCLFAVLVRSWVGFLFSMPWKQGFWLILLAAAASAVGKAAGGLLADRFGGRAVGTVSLLASIPLVILGGDSVVLSVTGIVCFNAAMSITLHTAAARLPRWEGFAFGLTTLALLLGYLAVNYISLDGILNDVTVIVTSVLAAGAVWLSAAGRSVKK